MNDRVFSNDEQEGTEVSQAQTEQEKAPSQIMEEWNLLQNKRAKVHQEALRLSQERELVELESQEIIESKVREEMKGNRRKIKIGRKKI